LRNYLEKADIERKIILRWIINKDMEGVWTGFIRRKMGFSGGFCENGNESWVSIK